MAALEAAKTATATAAIIHLRIGIFLQNFAGKLSVPELVYRFWSY
jgi:pheromone shutdown protein TraB